MHRTETSRDCTSTIMKFLKLCASKILFGNDQGQGIGACVEISQDNLLYHFVILSTLLRNSLFLYVLNNFLSFLHILLSSFLTLFYLFISVSLSHSYSFYLLLFYYFPSFSFLLFIFFLFFTNLFEFFVQYDIFSCSDFSFFFSSSLVSFLISDSLFSICIVFSFFIHIFSLCHSRPFLKDHISEE